MRKTTKGVGAALMCLALGVSLGACSSTPEENESAACDSYAAFAGTVAEVRTSLNSDSSIAEIKDGSDKVKDAYADLKESIGTVSADRQEALDEAWTSLDTAISDLDADLSVPEAKNAIESDLETVEMAQAEVKSDLSC